MRHAYWALLSLVCWARGHRWGAPGYLDSNAAKIALLARCWEAGALIREQVCARCHEVRDVPREPLEVLDSMRTRLWGRYP